MLKIRKQLPLSAAIDETEYTKNQEDIKNSIKQLFISNQGKKKTIDNYAKFTTQIREEYAKLQAKYVQLEAELQKYKDYVYQPDRHQPFIPPQRKRFFRKTKIPYYESMDKGYVSADERENDEEYFDYESKPKPKRKKRIIYFDEMDGDGDGDDNNENNEKEEEQEEENENEEYVKVLKRKKPVVKKLPSKESKKKVGITKSI